MRRGVSRRGSAAFCQPAGTKWPLMYEASRRVAHSADRAARSGPHFVWWLNSIVRASNTTEVPMRSLSP